MATLEFDALVVGAGFVYALKKLLDQGLNVKLIETAEGVAGTWWWNRYPGAMSDSESYLYRYSWDHEDLISYPWARHYVKGPEIRAYLDHVVDRHKLRSYMQFGTEMKSAQWIESKKRWFVKTSKGEVFSVRYLITALGILSKINFPDITGLKSFQGQVCHTAAWPESLDIRGKRVGIIGSGSSGVQVITEIAKDVKELICFQRTPQYSVPSGDRPVEPGYREDINQRYSEIWEQAKNSMTGFGFGDATRPMASVSEAERQEIFETAWQKGNGFRFMFNTFCDITYDEAANVAASDFIKSKIRTIVKDPEKVRKLLPPELYTKRPICDGGYYEQFNRDNVEIVALRETPIAQIVPTGIQTSDGKVHELDVIVFATGFDAIDGNYMRVSIKGRNEETLKDHWEPNGPISYLGVSVSNFPNLFMAMGPLGAFSNLPPALEACVEYISDMIAGAERARHASGKLSKNVVSTDPVIEVTPETEMQWLRECEALSACSLFQRGNSWINNSNVPGQRKKILFYLAGLAAYRKRMQEALESGLKGYLPFFETEALPLDAAPNGTVAIESVP